MAMLRPAGKAMRIAERTIPGFKRNRTAEARKKERNVPKDEVELKITMINEDKGRNL